MKGKEYGMIHLDEKMLRQLQLIQLELLEEVDRICRRCDIKYNIIAGTLLGAVRHGGYIPWDDDADVALLRPEYEKFRNACKTELDKSRFVFQDHRNTKGYRWGYGKIRMKNTLFLRENQEHMPYFQGVFIDVFPLDNVPDNYIHRCIHNFECFCIRKILWSEVGKYAEQSKIKKIVYSILSKIPINKVYEAYHRLIYRSNQRKTKMVRILTFPTPNRHYGYLRRWYENSIEIKFEGKSFMGIRDYDEYLTFKFGEYMKLPPEDQRKVHPVSNIKLIHN